MNGTLREVGEGVRDRVDRAYEAMRRTAPGVILVRLAVGVAAFAALALAFPDRALTGRPVTVLLILALGAALAPRSRWITMVALTAIAGWVVSTTFMDRPVTLWRVSLLGAALYMMHTGAALAAVLPYDAVISPGVLMRWWRRATAVIGVSLVVGVSALIVAERLTSVATLAAPLIGIVAATCLAVTLVALVRRR